ncbi:MAG: hypothetical protein WCR59_01700 [Planctomycetota bacterium]|jgi:hypothetical protein|nr:hypothetical protein [Planctomycetota bacterium]
MLTKTCAITLALATTAFAQAEVVWLKDFASARAMAFAQHRPLCVLFRCEA